MNGALTSSLQATPYWWVSPIVILFGSVVAIVAILTNRHVAKTKATLDLIERTESSEYYFKIRKAFKMLKEDSSHETLLRLASPKTDADKATSRQIYAYMNHYELVAIGCDSGILDEGFYASWMRGQLVNDWHICKEFVGLSRRVPESDLDPADLQPDLFVSFERLARRFENKTERGHRMRKFRGRLHLFYAERVKSRFAASKSR